MIQGGDFTHHDGTGGETIYGADIEDESFAVKHHRRFLLSSAHRGRRNSNASQFFITTVKAQWLDDHHVVFGLVMDGEEVVTAIEGQGTNGGIPKATITIVDVGVLELTAEERKPIPISRKDGVVD
jgi:peptidylprolyl isomerase